MKGDLSVFNTKRLKVKYIIIVLLVIVFLTFVTVVGIAGETLIIKDCSKMTDCSKRCDCQRKNCSASCDKKNSLIEQSNCINKCNAEWLECITCPPPKPKPKKKKTTTQRSTSDCGEIKYHYNGRMIWGT